MLGVHILVGYILLARKLIIVYTCNTHITTSSFTQNAIYYFIFHVNNILRHNSYCSGATQWIERSCLRTSMNFTSFSSALVTFFRLSIYTERARHESRWLNLEREIGCDFLSDPDRDVIEPMYSSLKCGKRESVTQTQTTRTKKKQRDLQTRRDAKPFLSLFFLASVNLVKYAPSFVVTV